MANIHFLSVFMSGAFTIESVKRTVADCFCKTPNELQQFQPQFIFEKGINFYVACIFFSRHNLTIFNVLLRHGPTAAFMNSTCSICVVYCFVCGVNVQQTGSKKTENRVEATMSQKNVNSLWLVATMINSSPRSSWIFEHCSRSNWSFNGKQSLLT